MNSQALRNEYPDLVVGGVDQYWNVTGTKPTCDYSLCEAVAFAAAGAYSSDVHLKVHPVTDEAWRALAAIMRSWGYTFNETAGGSVSCRKITGGTRTSLHAHGIAVDFNPSKNSYRRTYGGGLIQWGRQTDMPKDMVVQIEGIRTNDGAKVFRWGGRWTNIKDPMHYEVNTTKAHLLTGIDWSSVPATHVPQEDEEMITLTTPYTKGDDVKYWQLRMNEGGLLSAPLTTDGIFGNNSKNAVNVYRAHFGLEASGIIDMTFSNAMAAFLAPASGGVPPHEHPLTSHEHQLQGKAI